jgi:Mn2+/Fe2+ NRAMP family transporter
MVAMMLLVTNRKVMKQFAAKKPLAIAGWAGTALMLAAVIALGVTSF